MTTIWHNPRCSKSRETLALLREHNQDITIRTYLDDAPSPADIRAALDALGLRAVDIIRTGEALFKELGLSKTDTDAALITAMTAHPKLIERPIVFKGDRAALGRPPQAVLDIL